MKVDLPKFRSPWLIKPKGKVHLGKLSTRAGGSFPNEGAANALLEKHRATMDNLQEKLYAGAQRALLIVLQGMDTAGKDGTIRHIFTGVNPQGCDVTAFKVPTSLEARHDFLWRAHLAVPPRGMIGIFNRSHYEDVLSPRVHGIVSDKQARERLEQINDWERMLVENGTVVVKFFLHISHAEQGRRLQSRIDDSSKHWKLSEGDFVERKFWPKYCSAYEDILEHTSKKHAPWFVIPSDHKWLRNVAISQVLVDVMQGMNLAYPAATADVSKLKV
jgi:PPK2 family polyphosphate:nucleotide phosphotransferase